MRGILNRQRDVGGQSYQLRKRIETCKEETPCPGLSRSRSWIPRAPSQAWCSFDKLDRAWQALGRDCQTRRRLADMRSDFSIQRRRRARPGV